MSLCLGDFRHTSCVGIVPIFDNNPVLGGFIFNFYGDVWYSTGCGTLVRVVVAVVR